MDLTPIQYQNCFVALLREEVELQFQVRIRPHEQPS